MLFTSISFLYYFLPIVLITYFVLPKKLRNTVLCVASLIFYFYGEPKYIILMLAEILIAYIVALLINKHKSKSILVLGIVIHVGLLCVFKYTDFIVSNINSLFNTNLSLLRLAIPIGISFYTFQILSYEIDVYRGKVKVQKNLLKLATYVTLFPQLIAGPIVRYETIEKELDERKETREDFAYGVTRFTTGLAKKVLIANMLGELCKAFLNGTEKSVAFYWIYGIAYALQIYFDFSAYSDMAIGLGRMFGFHFLENFNYPYISKSITEFWRRWHISLSSWFKDYVYIPLGGNRVGKAKHIRNIAVVWLLTGIWHGASWNFVIWGAMFGGILLIEKFFLGKYLEKAPNFIKRLYVLFIVMVSFIIFNANNMGEAITNIAGLFGANGERFINKFTIYNLRSYAIILIIGIIGATPIPKNFIQKLQQKTKTKRAINLLEPVYVAVLLIVVTAYLVDNSYNPFLYFRF